MDLMDFYKISDILSEYHLTIEIGVGSFVLPLVVDIIISYSYQLLPIS